MQSTSPRRGQRESGRRRSFSSSSARPHGRGGSSHGRASSGRRGFGSRGGSSHGGGRPRTARKLPTFNPSQFINKNPVDVAPVEYEQRHSFADFKLNGRLTRTIQEMGITTPSPIQDQIIPEILAGKDVIGLAETGTGKTAAFLVPLIDMTLRTYKRQTLVLTPTRELALQIEAELKKLSVGNKIFSTTCVGGTNIRPQISALRRHNHFIIGTPGRILDLIDRRNLRTDQITSVVLDEADRMLDMGFIHDITKILSTVPTERETLFFSATMDDKTKGIVDRFMKKPVTISVKKKDVTNSIEQDVVPHGHHDKFETLQNLLADADTFKRVIIFGSMKHSVEKLAQELSAVGIVSESIHGNKSHGQRQRSLNRFKSGNARVLVATDVAARGIHVDNVTHVINYDLPQTFEDYVHRIGRTGRGKERGMALTFVPNN